MAERIGWFSFIRLFVLTTKTPTKSNFKYFIQKIRPIDFKHFYTYQCDKIVFVVFLMVQDKVLYFFFLVKCIFHSRNILLLL